MTCSTCNDTKWVTPNVPNYFNTKWVTPNVPNYFNCEGGGDCSKDIPNWTKEDCKTCGKVECPDCNGGDRIWMKESEND